MKIESSSHNTPMRADQHVVETDDNHAPMRIELPTGHSLRNRCALEGIRAVALLSIGMKTLSIEQMTIRIGF
jgi:hypothetical protein